MLSHHEGVIGYIHAARVLLLLAVVPISLVRIFHYRSGGPGLSWSGPCRLLLMYSIVALACAVFSPSPLYAFYWGVVFVAALLAAEAVVAGPDAQERAKNLMLLTYVIVAVNVAGILIVGRSVVFEGELTSGTRIYA